MQDAYTSLPDVTILVNLTAYNRTSASGTVRFVVPEHVSRHSDEMSKITIPFQNHPSAGFVIDLPESWISRDELQGVIREISQAVISTLRKYGVVIAQNKDAKFV